MGRPLRLRQREEVQRAAEGSAGGASRRTSTAAALKQREDIARLNVDAQAELTKAGLTFNKPDPAPFRNVLQSAGFYTEWKQKFGDEVWAKLEKYAGKLA